MRKSGWSFAAAFAGALLPAGILLAQGQTAPPGGGGPTAPAPTPTTPTTPTSPFPGGQTRPGQPGQQQDPMQRSPFPEMSRPIFLSGKVILDDGTPPPEPVTIERVCNGIARPEAYTDSKGRFSFQLGQNSHVMPDASVSASSDFGFPNESGSRGGGFPGTPGARQVTERDLIGCELRAALPGFRSEHVNLTGRRVMDNPDVGAIILRRLGNVEGLTISATSLNAPKDARKALDKSRELMKKNPPKIDEAQKELEKAVQMYPKYAVAWQELGVIHEKRSHVEDARKAYAAAIEADSKYVNPYLQLAQIAAREQKWQDVADTTDRIVKMNPVDFPMAFFFNSVAYLQLGKLDPAEKSAREALKLDTNKRIVKLDHVLGVILAQKGDFPAAAQSMRSYLLRAPMAGDADLVKKQLAEVERLSGQSSAARQAGQQ